MSYVDKHNKLTNAEFKSLTLELGCGDKRSCDHTVTIDSIDHACVDVVGDVYEVLADLPSNCIDGVLAYHFIEHVIDLDRLLRELLRVTRNNATIELSVPHFSNPFFYSDPTHKTAFGLYTFAYYFENNFFKRMVPNYSRIEGAELTSIKLIFKSYRPNYMRHCIKKSFQVIFNISPWMQELYEEIFTFIIPCYEIVYKVKRVR